jgi:uncharacterized protein (TIGR02453 family)
VTEKPAFAGWPDEALEFFEGLEADNSKAYWEPHRAIFESAVKAPMETLLAELEGEFGPFKIMRPYRDVRFSANKTPYKTHIGAGGGGNGGSGVYVSFSAQGIYAGGGTWHMSKDQLVRYREAVDGAAGADLEAIGAALAATGFALEGETLKRAPKGWPADHPRITLLRYTSVLVGRHFPPEPWMATAEARDRVVEVWRAAGPANAWLDDHVGPAEVAP